MFKPDCDQNIDLPLATENAQKIFLKNYCNGWAQIVHDPRPNLGLAYQFEKGVLQEYVSYRITRFENVKNRVIALKQKWCIYDWPIIIRYRCNYWSNRTVPVVEQQPPTLTENPRSSPVFSGVSVTRSLVFCVLLYKSLLVLLSLFCWSLSCLSFELPLQITLLWYLRFTPSDYPFGILDLRLQITPLVSSNSSCSTVLYNVLFLWQSKLSTIGPS